MRKEDITRMIEEEGVEFIRLQFTDIFGRLKNLAVTPGQMDRVFDNRYSFYGAAMFANTYDFDDRLYLYPDLDTFMILPWRPQQGKVAKIICNVCYMDGTPFEHCSRYILKQAAKKAEERIPLFSMHQFLAKWNFRKRKRSFCGQKLMSPSKDCFS